MKNRKPIRELLAEKGMDPIDAMIDLVDELKRDKEKFKRGIDQISIEEFKREAIKSGLDIDKVKLRVLQALNDAVQREDDQAIKLAELQFKRESEDRKQKELSGDRKVHHEYVIPGYAREVSADGKYKMIKLEGDARKNDR